MWKRAILGIFFCLYVLTAARVHTIDGRIKITIGTTSGCGDTVRFIDQQLLPAYELYKEYLEVEFVPWGRTRRDPNGTYLICQFGVNDCWANQLHRCSLHLLRDDQDAQIDYMSCEFTTPYPSFLQNSYQCALAAGLNLNDINNCISSDSRNLEDLAEVASAVPMQIINFVPYITFNNVIDVESHNQARADLTGLLSSALEDDSSSGYTNSVTNPWREFTRWFLWR